MPSFFQFTCLVEPHHPLGLLLDTGQEAQRILLLGFHCLPSWVWRRKEILCPPVYYYILVTSRNCLSAWIIAITNTNACNRVWWISLRSHSHQPCLSWTEPLVRFIWVGVNTGLELWCGPINCSQVSLVGLVLDRYQGNSRAVYCWCEPQSPQ